MSLLNIHPLSKILTISLLASMVIACSEEVVVVLEDTSRPVKMFTVGGSESTNILKYPGRVAAALRSELAFEVQGKIVEFNYTEGEKVQQGDIIAQLDARDYEASFNSVNARLNAAKQQVSRIEELKERDFASQREVDQAEREMEVLSAQLLQAEKAVDDTSLRAPFTGVLANKLIEDFANVQAKQVIGLLQDRSHLHVTVNIPESDFRYANPSQSIMARRDNLNVQVSISTFPDRTFTANLYEIATNADPQTGTFRTTVEFTPPADILILPGMTASVSLEINNANNSEQSLLVPSEAIFSSATGEPLIWLIDTQKMQVRQQSISVGMLSGSSIEVLSGIEAGDVIATSGVNSLNEGMQVSPYQSRSK